MRAMWTLAGETATAEIVDALRSGGVEVLVLKGPSIDRWLYAGEQPRVYSDIDLLVSPERLAAAERLLKQAGMSNKYDGVSPGWAEEHADVWESAGRPLPVDLHRRLWGCEAPRELVWARLWSQREEMKLAGRTCPVLSEPARLVVLALHAAHHHHALDQPLVDLGRAVDIIDPGRWIEAHALSLELDAEVGFRAGLALMDADEHPILEQLGLDPADPRAISVTPAMWGVAKTGEGFVRLAEAEGFRAKARLLLRELVPSSAFMRSRSAQRILARRGRMGLLRAYPLRWVQLLLATPKGLIAARRERARARRDSIPPR